jgi:hypothetical protein
MGDKTMTEMFPDEPPEPEPPHWTMDLEPGATVEGLADSLTREAEAVAALDAGPVYVRRGDGPWTEITAEERRRRRGP